jgi:hypothetical protein
MNENLRSFLDFLALNELSVDDLPGHVAEMAIWFIDEENLPSMLRILGNAKGHANLTFWERINRAPYSEEKWGELIVIGSGMSDEAKERNLKQYRTAVELVRKFVGLEQLRRNVLFRSDNPED